MRSAWLALILVAALPALVHAQARAGCGEINVCGNQKGSSGTRTGQGTSQANSRNARATAAMQSMENTQLTNQQIMQQGSDAMMNVLTSGQRSGDADTNSNGVSDAETYTDSNDTTSSGDNNPTPYTPTIDYAALAAANAAAARCLAKV